MKYYIHGHMSLFGLRSTDRNSHRTKRHTNDVEVEFRLAKAAYSYSLHQQGRGEINVLFDSDPRRGKPILFPRIWIIDDKERRWDLGGKAPVDIHKAITAVAVAHKLAIMDAKTELENNRNVDPLVVAEELRRAQPGYNKDDDYPANWSKHV